MTLRRWVLACFCLCWAGALSAQVYKCQQGGKTIYSDTPCAQGTQSEVAVGPALASDAQTQEAARKRSADEIRRADKVVEDARKRTDADAKRRTEIAVAEHKAEEARLKKEAAEAKAAAKNGTNTFTARSTKSKTAASK